MVVSAHSLATEAGRDVLAGGGNAVDAAITTAFVLAVVYPAAGNLAGGGFLVSVDPAGNERALDFREVAPAASSRDMYLDEHGEVVGRASLDGWLAVGVPGSVAGLLEAQETLGTHTVAEIIEPARRIAAAGFVLDRRDADALNHQATRLAQDPGAGAIFTRESGPWSPGDTLRQPDLAATLGRIAKDGRSGFYGGLTAKRLADAMVRGKGLITESDLANYRPIWRRPVTGAYRGYRVVSMPPPSSGGIAVIGLLTMTEAHRPATLGAGSSAWVHLQAEMGRRIFSDRAVHLGDPDYWDVPVQGLLDRDYLHRRMSDFDSQRAGDSSHLSAGAPPSIPAESDETTHLSVVDKAGWAVSITTTLNASFGAAVVAPGTGFLLNDEMDDFSAKAGVPNQFGLVGAEANAIAPSKRPLSSMSPTILTRDGRVVLVVGSPGGSRIITTVFQTIVNVVDFGMNAQEAVSWPRVHHQWLPDQIRIEPLALGPDALNALVARGHRLDIREHPWSMAAAIRVRDDGTLEAGADPRGPATAAGVH